MPRTLKNHLEFANFICKFGEQNLHDRADDIVLPALMSSEKRQYGGSNYFLHSPKLMALEGGEVGLVFEFVKDGKIDREQVFTEGRVKDDYKYMDSAPSAYVLLVLNNHRLVYLPKTKNAPGLTRLEATCKVLIERQRKRVIAKQLEEAKPAQGYKGKVRQQLEAKLPPVTLHIVPLTSAEEVHKAISHFGLIRTLTITLVASNNDLDYDDFFKQWRKGNEALGASKSTLTHQAPPGKSLLKPATEKEVKAAGQQGQALVKVSGTDADGEQLIHTNESVRLRKAAKFKLKSLHGNAVKMFEALKAMMTNGMVKTGPVVDDVKAKVAAVWEEWKPR